MSRAGEHGLRLRCGAVFAGWMLAAGFFTMAHAQYPGRVNPNDGATPVPVLRATAVLEYTGDLTKPTAARLVPVAVWDGERYQPGGLYMAQPMPLAVESGTVYELLDAGSSKGLFDVKAAANVSGSWVATGTYQRPAPVKVARLKPSKTLPQFVHDAGTDDSKPHFAHRPPGDSGSGSGSGSSSGSTSGTASGSGSGSSSGSGSGSAGNSSSTDSGGPTLHRRTDSTTGEQSGSSSGSGLLPARDRAQRATHRTLTQTGRHCTGARIRRVKAVQVPAPDRAQPATHPTLIQTAPPCTGILKQRRIPMTTALLFRQR